MASFTHPWNMVHGKTIPRESKRMISRLQLALNNAWRTHKGSTHAEKCGAQEAWTAFLSVRNAKLQQHGVGRYAVYLPGPQGAVYELEHIPPYSGAVAGCVHTPSSLTGFVVADTKTVDGEPVFEDLLYFRSADHAVLAIRHKHKFNNTVSQRGYQATVIHNVYACQHRMEP